MKLEHIALNVPNALETAKWYTEHLGMRLVRGNKESPFIHFLLDSAGVSVLEFSSNPVAPTPDYGAMHPVMLHLAFLVDDIEAERDRLVQAGATAEGDTATAPNGDQLAFIRDPWGVAVQLVKRTAPLV
jgi:catechol 2,3-dioxygenase-like lactoylglutathione lyase family enzyme